MWVVNVLFGSCLTTMTLSTAFFATLCTIKGDTSDVPKEMIIGLDGTHFAQDFKVILLCGLTEMKAQIAWIKDVRPFNVSSIFVF